MKLVDETHATAGGNPQAYRAPIGAEPSSSAARQPLVLPPKCSAAHFKTFVERAGDICSEENVTIICSPEELDKEKYMDPSKAHDMYHVFEKEHFVSSAVIAPRGVEDVQNIVRLCNEFEIPLWPFSIGRNVGSVLLQSPRCPDLGFLFYEGLLKEHRIIQIRWCCTASSGKHWSRPRTSHESSSGSQRRRSLRTGRAWSNIF